MLLFNISKASTQNCMFIRVKKILLTIFIWWLDQPTVAKLSTTVGLDDILAVFYNFMILWFYTVGYRHHKSSPSPLWMGKRSFTEFFLKASKILPQSSWLPLQALLPVLNTLFSRISQLERILISKFKSSCYIIGQTDSHTFKASVYSTGWDKYQ